MPTGDMAAVTQRLRSEALGAAALNRQRLRPAQLLAALYDKAAANGAAEYEHSECHSGREPECPWCIEQRRWEYPVQVVPTTAICHYCQQRIIRTGSGWEAVGVAVPAKCRSMWRIGAHTPAEPNQ
jgi:hypothetical protein